MSGKSDTALPRGSAPTDVSERRALWGAAGPAAPRDGWVLRAGRGLGRAGLTSMCWNMYGWLQIFLSCMMVFIRVLVPPLPWRGRREDSKSGPVLGWVAGGRTMEGEVSGEGVAHSREIRSEELALTGAQRPETNSGGSTASLVHRRGGRRGGREIRPTELRPNHKNSKRPALSWALWGVPAGLQPDGP